MKRLTVCIILGFLVAVLLLSGCGKPKIRVASKQDVEGTILAQLIIQYLDYRFKTANQTVDIIDNTWMYTTDTLRDALIDGDIDIYPEYTGNGCLWFTGLCENQTFKDAENVTTIRQILNKKETLNNTGLTWLTPAPAENNWAIVINSKVANQTTINTTSKLFDYMKENPKGVTVYGSKAFFENNNAFKLYETEYDYVLSPEQKRYVSNPIFAENLAAYSTNTEPIRASMAYTTDRYLVEDVDGDNVTYLKELPLKILEDSEHVLPRFYPVPLIRTEIYEDYPDPDDPSKNLIDTYLKDLFKHLNNQTLQELNSQAVEKYPDEIAGDFLEKVFRIVSNDDDIRPPSGRPPEDFFEPGENTTIEIVNARITVPAHNIWESTFYIDNDFMKTANLRGWVSVSGGAFNDIKIAVLSDNDYTNWNNFRKTEDAVYLSGKVTKTQFDLDIDLDKHKSGTYHLVLSNLFSEFSYKEVTLKVYFYFTPMEPEGFTANSSNG